MLSPEQTDAAKALIERLQNGHTITVLDVILMAEVGAIPRNMPINQVVLRGHQNLAKDIGRQL